MNRTFSPWTNAHSVIARSGTPVLGLAPASSKAGKSRSETVRRKTAKLTSRIGPRTNGLDVDS